MTAALSIGLAAILPSACDPFAEQPVRQLRMSVITNVDHSLYKGAVKFADLVKERTGGKVLISVYPNSQLAGGNITREVDMLREGKIDFSFTSSLIYANLDKRFFASCMPWIFPGNEAADRFLTGPVGHRILGMAREYGIEGLALGENGFRQITNSLHPIRTPEDLRGLRIRVPSEMYAVVYRALGAEPTVMTWPGVYKALQERALDGQENPVGVTVAYRVYDVQKYMTVWNYSYDTYLLGANQKVFESFDPHTRQIVREAAREATTYQVRLARETARAQEEMLKEKGMEVTRLTPEEIAVFRSRMEAAYGEYETVMGKDLLDSLRALGR